MLSEGRMPADQTSGGGTPALSGDDLIWQSLLMGSGITLDLPTPVTRVAPEPVAPEPVVAPVAMPDPEPVPIAVAAP